jgi:surface polysaccharide O-acyltransferase-like enzyme
MTLVSNEPNLSLLGHESTSAPDITDHSPTPGLGTTRILDVDVIKVWAIILVVLIHVSAQLMYSFNSLPPNIWWVANWFDSFARPAVPLFLMMSGLLLLAPGKTESLRTFFAKRVRRVVVPFLFWACVYLGWRIGFNHEDIPLAQLPLIVIQGPVYFHLGFVYYLLGLYLAVPVLRPMVRQASRQELIYFVVVWFLAVAILPVLYRFSPLRVGIPFYVMTGFSGYLVLGELVRPVHLGLRGLGLTLLGLLALTAITAYATYRLTVSNGGALDEFFFDYAGPNVILMAIGMALALKSMPHEAWAQRVPAPYGWIRQVSNASFSIYLFHVIPLEVLQSGRLGFVLDAATIHPLVGIPLTAAAVLLISLSVTWLARRIPALRPVFP